MPVDHAILFRFSIKTFTTGCYARSNHGWRHSWSVNYFEYRVVPMSVEKLIRNRQQFLKATSDCVHRSDDQTSPTSEYVPQNY